MNEKKSPASEHCRGGEATPSRDRDAVAKAVAEARKRRLPYKILAALTGYSRTRLHQLKKLGENL